jgi:hypothetical protein
MKGLIKFVNLSTIIFFVFALYSYFQKQEINIENNQISSQQEISIENNN